METTHSRNTRKKVVPKVSAMEQYVLSFPLPPSPTDAAKTEVVCVHCALVQAAHTHDILLTWGQSNPGTVTSITTHVPLSLSDTTLSSQTISRGTQVRRGILCTAFCSFVVSVTLFITLY
jgi:hypothetical protein